MKKRSNSFKARRRPTSTKKSPRLQSRTNSEVIFYSCSKKRDVARKSPEKRNEQMKEEKRTRRVVKQEIEEEM